MSHPQDPEATSVISWGTSAAYTPDIGKHHVEPPGYDPDGPSNGYGSDAGGESGRRPSPRPADDYGDVATHDTTAHDTYAHDTYANDTTTYDPAEHEILPAVTGEALTCPECGTVSHVTLNRREAVDFCHTCDYPLFWAPKKILRGSGEQTDESLRRLPGTSGRVSVASLPCPFCAEPNAINAHTCVRCGRPMHPVAAPPPPPPPRAYVPPPPPEPVWEPEPGIAWWVWLLLALGVVALAVVIVLIATGVIG